MSNTTARVIIDGVVAEFSSDSWSWSSADSDTASLLNALTPRPESMSAHAAFTHPARWVAYRVLSLLGRGQIVSCTGRPSPNDGAKDGVLY